MGNTSKPNLASVPRQESESELRSEQLFGAYPEPVLEHTPSSDLPCRSSPGDYLAVSPRYQTSTSPGVSFPGHMDWNGCEFLSFPEDYTRTRGRYPHEEDYDVSAVSFSSTTIPPETYTLPPSNFLSISPQRYEFFDYFPDNIPCSTGLVTHLEKLPPLASKSPPSTSMSNSPAATICSGAKIPGGTAPAEAGKPARAEAGGAAMPTRAKAARYVMPTGPGIFESASIRGQLSTEIEKLVTATRALTT
ncbi:hypothetical protein M501DRAFT_995923 [Patellaria atrata CBS 101060]|uniref:Uncharacterized protein n=1 Tax=Patellaria atrata CBS 101060 TaxID=1346257 RepID=A0A9P4VQ16_9PEZI|nr:hypothetical protein M501DRAFT_995923 [Patellaria atrata CBS 101060]